MAQDIESRISLAHRLIADQNKLKLENIQAAGWVADLVPSTGALIHRVSAVAKDKPNGQIYSVVIDDQGKAIDLATLSRREKVDFFPPFPRAGAEGVNPSPKSELMASVSSVTVPVTISPNVNDLHLTPGQVLTEDIHVIVPALPDPFFDVYFLADTTGSMGNIITAVKAAATGIMNTLHAAYPTMAFAVGNYKDFGSGDPYCFQHQQSPSVPTAPVQTAINAWSASGGNDGPEGQFFALDQIATNLATIQWRPGAQRIVVWFGDAPGHDPICAPQFVPLPAITEALLTSHLSGAQIKVLAISTNTGYALGLNDDATPTAFDYPCPNTGLAGQGGRIASATGGSYASGVNAATIANTILAMITAATNLFNNIHLAASGGTAPFVTSITPAAGYGPVDNKGHDYVFKVTFTGPPCKDTDQVYTGTIDVVADGKVVAQKKVTLTVIACERWSYGVKFLCGYVKEGPPGVVPLTAAATLRPGIYATEVNILNHQGGPVTVHKYLYPLMRQTEPVGREPRFVGRRAADAITLPPKTATFDDCFRLHELLHEVPTDEPLSIYFLELVSPVELTVTAVYTANDLRGVSVSLDVVQVEGKKI
ncbi:MAG TPA: hypothetical protein VGO01_13470 [Bradyrhizobium sp.]|nr:hypothetical protein [Bradyrhizobium sp.]